MQIIQLLDASSKWRNFFNRRKLKGRNKLELPLVDLQPEWVHLRGETQILHTWGKKSL